MVEVTGPRTIDPSAVRAVIFDMDGVLIDSSCAQGYAWRTVLARYGVDYDASEFRVSGISTLVVAGQFVERFDLPVSAEELAPQKVPAYLDEIERVQLFDEAHQVLDALRASGRSVALGTAEEKHAALLLVERFDLVRRLDAIVTRDDAPRPKPFPDIFERAAKLVGAAPADCLVVEDAPAGVAAAHAAGMPAVSVITTHTADELAEADARIESLGGVLGVLGIA